MLSPSDSTDANGKTGLRARLNLKTRRTSSSSTSPAGDAVDQSKEANSAAVVTSPSNIKEEESSSHISLASNTDRSPYGAATKNADRAAKSPTASTPSHRRMLSWASGRHKRTPSSTSQTQARKEQDSSAEHTPTSNDSKAPGTGKQAQSSRSIPISTQLPGNPLAEQSAYIVRYFAAAAASSLLVSYFLHPIVGIVVVATLSFVLHTQLQTATRDAAWERSAGLKEQELARDQSRNSESAEWMNAILKTVWPLISQDIFVPFIDLLEDALMQQVPGIVHSCRVEDLDQGNVPLLIQSFTLLDPSVDGFNHGNEQRSRDASDSSADGQESAMPAVDVGDYINLEVTFAYRSPTARKQRTKSNRGDTVMSEEERQGLQSSIQDSDIPVDQIHMLIYMAIGLQKIAAVEVPVWCEVLGIEGKMRLRVQLVPTAPFVGHVAFTFVGIPKLEMSAKPLGRRMVIDAMHLPLISSYVLHSVEAVVKDFISPKSYTVDIASLLDSKDGPRNVYSLGTVVLVIHQASNLPAADNNGTSDPFVSVSFAKAGKPIFTTRVLLKTRDPIWHEMAVLLVSPDEVRDHEQLRLTVFDADRFSVDDPLGKVDISIDKLIRRALSETHTAGKPSLFETQTADLQPLRRGKEAEGQLRYSVGFFRLAKPSQSDRTASKQRLLQEAAGRQSHEAAGDEKAERDEAEQGAGVAQEQTELDMQDKDLDRFLTPFDRFVSKLGLPIDASVLQRRKARMQRVHKLRTMMEGEAQATIGPPNTEWPSGILAFHIHSIDNLGFEPPQRSYTNSKRLSQKPRYSEDADPLGEGASKMPNSYVQVIINDEAVFRTRTKTLNPRPYINAGGERFISDFNRARVDFVVRDQRQRESDAILGIVGLPLHEVLRDECRLTQWYTLSSGLGYGKIRITLLWRSTEVNVPRPLRGWNVGVLEIASCCIGGISSDSHRADFERRDAHLLFETVGGRATTDSVEPHDEYESGEGSDATFGFRWPMTAPIRIAVRQRYPNFLYVHLRTDSRVPGRAHKFAHAVIPLIWLEDDTETTRRVPIYEAGNGDWQQFEQDVMHSFTSANHDLSDEDPGRRHLPILDDLCQSEASTDEKITKGATQQDNETLKRIGYVEVVLLFHAGLAPEHKSLIAGDRELRVAYESWVTLVDNNQRPKPKMLSTAHRRKLSNAGSLSSPAPKAEGADGKDEITSGPSHSRINSKIKAQKGRASISDIGHGEDEDDDDSAWGPSEAESGDEADDGLIDVDSPDGRRARIRSLHRQQRGAAQVKPYRTLEWIKTNAEDGLGRIRRKASRAQQKRISKMESEGVSHF